MILLYIDPGSGSFLFQILMAGILGVAFYFKQIRRKIAAIFGQKLPQDEEA